MQHINDRFHSNIFAMSNLMCNFLFIRLTLLTKSIVPKLLHVFEKWYVLASSEFEKKFHIRFFYFILHHPEICPKNLIRI